MCYPEWKMRSGFRFHGGKVTLGNRSFASGVSLLVRHGTIQVIAVIALVATFLVVSRNYRLSSLNPSDFTRHQKPQKPPELPQDCSEIRRAVTLSTESIVSGKEKSAKVTRPLDADEVGIYKAVIEQWNSNDPATLNVSSETFFLDTTFSSETSECGCWAGFSPDNLLKASHSFHILTENDLPKKGVRLVHPREQNAIVARNDPGVTIRDGRTVEDAVDTAFANGLFSMSEIVFDKEHLHALVSYAFHCGALCGSGATWILEKVDGQWKKADRACGGWVS